MNQIFTTPFEWIAVWLRKLSLSGSSGNCIDHTLYHYLLSPGNRISTSLSEEKEDPCRLSVTRMLRCPLYRHLPDDKSGAYGPLFSLFDTYDRSGNIDNPVVNLYLLHHSPGSCHDPACK